MAYRIQLHASVPRPLLPHLDSMLGAIKVKVVISASVLRLNKMFLDTLILKTFFKIMKINHFGGDLTDAWATKEARVVIADCPASPRSKKEFFKY